RRLVSALVHKRVQRLSLRRAAVRRQPRSLRGSEEQLPERGAGSPDRYSDHAVGRLHGSRASRRTPDRRRELPRPFPGAAAGAWLAPVERTDHRSVPRRRDAVGTRLPDAAAEARRLGSRVQQVAAGAGDATADRRADAAEPEAHLRPYAIVSAGARRHRTAARRHAVGPERAARPRLARLPPE